MASWKKQPVLLIKNFQNPTIIITKKHPSGRICAGLFVLRRLVPKHLKIQGIQSLHFALNDYSLRSLGTYSFDMKWMNESKFIKRIKTSTSKRHVHSRYYPNFTFYKWLIVPLHKHSDLSINFHFSLSI